MTTFGYLYRRGLAESLQSIAEAGYRLVEIAPTPPHLLMPAFDSGQRRRLRGRLEDLGLTCCSVNPPDLNLISPNPELREVARRYYEEAIRLAADLGASVVVVIAGRQSPLVPMPSAAAEELSLSQLAALSSVAREVGVALAVETVPFGFTETTGQAVALVEKLGEESVGVAVDVANVFGRQSVGDAVLEAGRHLKIAHFSDSWRDRWAHTSIGDGEVDISGFLQALSSAGFTGPCVYELVDGRDPAPRIVGDLAKLRAWGAES